MLKVVFSAGKVSRGLIAGRHSAALKLLARAPSCRGLASTEKAGKIKVGRKAPKLRRAAAEAPATPGFFARLRARFKGSDEGLVPGPQLRHALAKAVALQTGVAFVSMLAEATLEGDEIGFEFPAEIPAAACVMSMVGSVVLFRRLVTPFGRAKWRWYIFLAPAQVLAIIGSALFIRTYIVPEEPPVTPEEGAELERVASALGLKALDADESGAAAINLQACLMGWSKLFLALTGGEDELTPEALLACNPHLEVFEACGLSGLIAALQGKQLLREAAFSVVLAGRPAGVKGVGVVDFVKFMLATQSALEGHGDHQAELLFRAMNRSGNGKLSLQELEAWLALMAEDEHASATLEADSIVDRGGWLGGGQRRLTVPQLARAYMRSYDRDRDGSLSFKEFKELAGKSSLKFAAHCLTGLLLPEPSPVLQAGAVLQFLMLNPKAVIKKKKKAEDQAPSDFRAIIAK